jgi:hypothetical protein
MLSERPVLGGVLAYVHGAVIWALLGPSFSQLAGTGPLSRTFVDTGRKAVV